MFTVIKNQGTLVNAYELGKPHPVLDRLMEAGQLLALESGDFEVFSQEAVHGTGELAHPGDFIKVDDQGFPYPNRRSFFKENHTHIQADMYEQHPMPLLAWDAEEPISESIAFLVAKKGLILSPHDPERYFTAPLWGTILSARKDAVLVFYSLTRDEQGNLLDADFNLVSRESFNKTYRRL